jgi:hypothetical protein
MPKLHSLKVRPEFFEKLLTGEKTFEIRANDRGFEVGDTLDLKEWDGDKFTGRWLWRDVLYISSYQQIAGYIVMALGETDKGSTIQPKATRQMGEAMTIFEDTLEQCGDQLRAAYEKTFDLLIRTGARHGNRQANQDSRDTARRRPGWPSDT